MASILLGRLFYSNCFWLKKPTRLKVRDSVIRRSLGLSGVHSKTKFLYSDPKHAHDVKMVQLYKAESEHNGEVEVVQVMSDEFGALPGCCRNSRLLILGAKGEEGLHSIYKMDGRLSGDYWDTLAILPAVCPNGTIGLYGLGAGTTAQMIHKLFPSQKMVGFEIDEKVLEASQFFMGVGHLQDSGVLECKVRNCLLPDPTLVGAFSGIAVDLYSCDKIINELEDVWRMLKSHLSPGGVIIANLGIQTKYMNGKMVEILMDVFHGDVLFKAFQANTLALMGPNPLNLNFDKVPHQLELSTKRWLTFQEVRSCIENPKLLRKKLF